MRPINYLNAFVFFQLHLAQKEILGTLWDKNQWSRWIWIIDSELDLYWIYLKGKHSSTLIQHARFKISYQDRKFPPLTQRSSRINLHWQYTNIICFSLTSNCVVVTKRCKKLATKFSIGGKKGDKGYFYEDKILIFFFIFTIKIACNSFFHG